MKNWRGCYGVCPVSGLCAGWSLTWVSVVTSPWRHVGVMTLRVMTRSSEDPASRSSAWLIRRPPPRNRKMFVCVMYRARLLYKPSPHCSWDQSIHQSVLLIHLLHTTRNNILFTYFQDFLNNIFLGPVAIVGKTELWHVIYRDFPNRSWHWLADAIIVE